VGCVCASAEPATNARTAAVGKVRMSIPFLMPPLQRPSEYHAGYKSLGAVFQASDERVPSIFGLIKGGATVGSRRAGGGPGPTG
jgi:hypothetical protein